MCSPCVLFVICPVRVGHKQSRIKEEKIIKRKKEPAEKT